MCLKKRFCIIINPIAGKGKTARKIPELKRIIETQDKGIFDLYFTEYHEHAIKLTQQYARDYDAVLAMGGDGTVNEVLRGVIGTGTVMGIIPEGRGNDFARSISFSENVQQTIDTILDFHTMVIDVGKIDNNYFMNGVGIGFDGYVNMRNQKRKWLKGPFSYYYTLLESLMMWKTMNMIIAIDGKEIPAGSVFLAAIGNGKYCGGGLNLNPYAEIDDQLLDICVVNDIGKLKIIRNLKRLKNGSINDLDEVTIRKCKKIKIFSEDLMPVHYDGEMYYPENNTIELSIVEKAVRILRT